MGCLDVNMQDDGEKTLEGHQPEKSKYTAN